MFRSCPAVPIKFKWDAFCPVYFPLDSVAERSFFDFHKKKKNPPLENYIKNAMSSKSILKLIVIYVLYTGNFKYSQRIHNSYYIPREGSVRKVSFDFRHYL